MLCPQPSRAEGRVVGMWRWGGGQFLAGMLVVSSFPYATHPYPYPIHPLVHKLVVGWVMPLGTMFTTERSTYKGVKPAIATLRLAGVWGV